MAVGLRCMWPLSVAYVGEGVVGGGSVGRLHVFFTMNRKWSAIKQHPARPKIAQVCSLKVIHGEKFQNNKSYQYQPIVTV